MNSTKFSSLAVLSSLLLLSLFIVSVTSNQDQLHAGKNATTQQHLQHPQQHKNDTTDEPGDKDEDGYDLDEDDKKEIKAIRRAVRALAHKMMMQNNMPMSTSNNNMAMTEDQQMQMMQSNPQDMNNMDTTMMEGSGDSMIGADGDSTMMEGMQQQGQMMQTNPQMMTSQQTMQQPSPYQQMNMMSHPNTPMVHTQPQQQQQHHMMGSQQMMNPNHPNMMMMNGQQQQNWGSHQMPLMMNHQNPMLGVRHVPSPSTPQDVQLTTVNATTNATTNNMTVGNIAQFNPLPGSRLQRSLYATQSNNANQQQSHVPPNQTSFNSQAPNNSINSTSEFQQGLNTTLPQDQQNGTNSQNSSQISEDKRPVHPKLQGVAHMFRNIF